MKKLLLLGAGGHFRSVLDSVKLDDFDNISLIDTPNRLGHVTHGLAVVGTDDDLPFLYNEGYQYAFITIGSDGRTVRRAALYEKLQKIGFTVPAIIDRTAIVSSEAVVMEGAFVGKGCILNSGVQVGECCIVNTGSIIEHDSVIRDFAHIAPGCCLAGGVYVGKNTHIGMASCILQTITVGSDSIIGAGSIVTRDIPSGVVAFGTPCKVRQRIGE